jgi:hypothetical protein
MRRMRRTTMHSPKCAWPDGEPCRDFSTDGTRLGAQIAHEMGTTDEREIAAMGRIMPPFVSDVEAEQADWEEE